MNLYPVIMKKSILCLITIAVLLFNCSSSNDDDELVYLPTQAKITLKNQNGERLQGVTVFIHLYGEGDEVGAASSNTEVGFVYSDEQGIAFFDILMTTQIFMDILLKKCLLLKIITL